MNSNQPGAMPGGKDTMYKVTTIVFDRPGKLPGITIIGPVECGDDEKRSTSSNRHGDVYVDIFQTRKEAEKFIRENQE